MEDAAALALAGHQGLAGALADLNHTEGVRERGTGPAAAPAATGANEEQDLLKSAELWQTRVSELK